MSGIGEYFRLEYSLADGPRIKSIRIFNRIETSAVEQRADGNTIKLTVDSEGENIVWEQTIDLSDTNSYNSSNGQITYDVDIDEKYADEKYADYRSGHLNKAGPTSACWNLYGSEYDAMEWNTF